MTLEMFYNMLIWSNDGTSKILGEVLQNAEKGIGKISRCLKERISIPASNLLVVSQITRYKHTDNQESESWFLVPFKLPNKNSNEISKYLIFWQLIDIISLKLLHCIFKNFHASRHTRLHTALDAFHYPPLHYWSPF